MDLRKRKRASFSGFTPEEVQRMEQLMSESKDHLKEKWCKNLCRVFNRSNGRAGKPAVNWIEIHCWFENNKKNWPVKVTSVDACKKSHESKSKDAIIALAQGKKGTGISSLEFEARSSVNGAWYDVDKFLSRRVLRSGDVEVLVRYAGFKEDDDEWVNVDHSVRERSVHLEDYDCHKVSVGDLALCFQEDQTQATYYDCHIVGIQRRLHDVRGCKCFFKIKYIHDNTEEKVRLERLCCRPNML